MLDARIDDNVRGRMHFWRERNIYVVPPNIRDTICGLRGSVGPAAHRTHHSALNPSTEEFGASRDLRFRGAAIEPTGERALR